MPFLLYILHFLVLYLNLDRLQVVKPLSQVLSSLVDQDSGNQMDQDSVSSDSYTIDEFEVRIFEPEKSGGHWEPRATIPMQTSENALTVRMVTLLVSSSMLLVQVLYAFSILRF